MENKERKDLIEKIALRWKKGGIEDLKTYGNFQKYTPIFHFHVSEPYDLKENFIYITELFGNAKQSPDDALPMNLVGLRRQLQRNYQGLQNIVWQRFSNPNIIPHEVKRENIGLMEIVNQNPTQTLGIITPKEKELFDNALLYFENVTKWLLPKNFKTDVHHETISHSHAFI